MSDDRDEYEAFYQAVTSAESATVHDFDKEKFFEGCLPIEVMAHRGHDTLRFGPMKPVGLTDPRTGRYPYAAVQLRQDTLAGDHYSLVGFQTQLKWAEQGRVLRMIPGSRMPSSFDSEWCIATPTSMDRRCCARRGRLSVARICSSPGKSPAWKVTSSRPPPG